MYMFEHNSGAPLVVSHKNNIFIYIGGGLGVGVFIILLVVVMFLMIIIVCMRRRRNSKLIQEHVETTVRVHFASNLYSKCVKKITLHTHTSAVVQCYNQYATGRIIFHSCLFSRITFIFLFRL